MFVLESGNNSFGLELFHCLLICVVYINELEYSWCACLKIVMIFNAESMEHNSFFDSGRTFESVMDLMNYLVSIMKSFGVLVW